MTQQCAPFYNLFAKWQVETAVNFYLDSLAGLRETALSTLPHFTEGRRT